MNNSVFERCPNDGSSVDKSTIVAGARRRAPVLPLPSGSFGGESLISSTPAEWNLSKMNGSGGERKMQKAGMSLNFGSANSSKEEGCGGRAKMRVLPHVTVRENLISPIVTTEGEALRHVQWTEPRVGGDPRQLFAGDSGEGMESAGSANSSQCGAVTRKVGFPYPEVPCEVMDSAELLRDALQALSFVNKVEMESQRLFGSKEKERLKKKEKKEEELVAPYQFDADTFVGVNSEAANHALHLVFVALDAKEAEQRFRDCWPVYEKKLEGVFRRVALDWIKQLVEANPLFFTELQPQSIGGLLVNPGGERFISFLRQLCRLAIYTVANRKKALIKQQVLLPPDPSPDPEICNRQLHILQRRSRVNAEAMRNEYIHLLRVNECFAGRMRKLEEISQLTERVDTFLSARLNSHIQNYPEYFGNPTEEQLKKREEAQQTLRMKEDILEKDDYPDFLRDRLSAMLKARVEKIYKPVTQLMDIMEDYGKLWYILEMDKDTPYMTLDCTKLGSDGSPGWSLNSYLISFLDKVSTVVNNAYLQSETPQELLQEYEQLLCRVNFLEVMRNEVLKHGCCDTSIVARAKPKKLVLKQSLGNIDWSLISKVKGDRGIGPLMDFTPFPKIYNISRATGRTPAIQNFLDSSSSSSSGELSSAVVVRRRNQGKRHTLSGLMQRSESEPVGTGDPRRQRLGMDTTDGGGKPPIGQTPLSSTHIHQAGSGSIVGASFRDCSLVATPNSAVSSVSSFRMTKSVSFGDTPSGTGESGSFSSVISMRRQQIQRRGGRMSEETPHRRNHFEVHGDETPLEPASREVSGNRSGLSLSFASGASTPVGALDSSTQDRLNKLMQSLAKTRESFGGRKSLSPIVQGQEGDSGQSQDNSGVKKGEDHEGTLDADKNETESKRLSLDLTDGALLSKSSVGLDSIAEVDFGDISMIEDFDEVKGIMETSYVELLRNSDSDD